MCQCVYLAVSALIISIPATANTIKFNRQVFDRLQDRLEFFEHKYGDIVSVYTVCDSKNICSKEICTGPHVNNTSELGHFKILKEESSAAGVRRIKGILK